jgi:hypothetical protein
MPIKKTSDYKKRDSLRPDVPKLANDASLKNASDTINVGDFGSWGASATVVNGLPKAK